MDTDELLTYDEMYTAIQNRLLDMVGENPQVPMLEVVIRFAVAGGYASGISTDFTEQQRSDFLAVTTTVTRDFVADMLAGLIK